MSNSIYKILDEHDFLADIVMSASVSRSAQLILEGVTDIKRFGKFISDNCSIVNCGGKEKLKKLIELTNCHSIPGVLFLLDADFDAIENRKLCYDHVIYSDTHDFDLDMILSGVISDIIFEYSKLSMTEIEIQKDYIINWHFDVLLPISCAKLACASGDIDVSLAKVDWVDAYSGGKINVPKYAAKALKKKTPNNEMINDFMQKIENNIQSKYDKWQITNGHDFCTLFGIYIQENYNGIHREFCSGKAIETQIRLAFNDYYFSKTDVYNSIRKWERDNAGYRVLK